MEKNQQYDQKKSQDITKVLPLSDKTCNKSLLFGYDYTGFFEYSLKYEKAIRSFEGIDCLYGENNTVTVTPNKKSILISTLNSCFYQMDIRSRKITSQFDFREEEIDMAIATDDNKFLITIGPEYGKKFCIQSGKELFIFSLNYSQIDAIKCYDDSKYLLIIGQDSDEEQSGSDAGNDDQFSDDHETCSFTIVDLQKNKVVATKPIFDSDEVKQVANVSITKDNKYAYIFTYKNHAIRLDLQTLELQKICVLPYADEQFNDNMINVSLVLDDKFILYQAKNKAVLYELETKKHTDVIVDSKFLFILSVFDEGKSALIAGKHIFTIDLISLEIKDYGKFEQATKGLQSKFFTMI